MSRTRVSFALACATGLAFAFLLTSCAISSDVSGSLWGTVRRADNSPAIADATIECAGLVTFSNSSGEYSLEGIQPGDRVVYASASGFENYSNVVRVGESTRLDIAMEVYIPPARLFGYVTHSVFGPIEGALVELGDLSTATDSLGFYEFPNVQQETYHMTVTKDGYRTLSANVTPSSSDYEFDIDLKFLATTTLWATADATVFENSPDANAGSAPLLQLFDNGIMKETCLVQFDLEGLEETAEPVLATMRLYHTVEPGSEANRTMLVALILEPWEEMQVTWANAPSNSGPAAVSSEYENGRFEADVTSYFSDWLVGGDTNNGLYLDTPMDHEAGRFYFASREYFEPDERPHVVLDYAW
jgi:hypothetical protein